MRRYQDCIRTDGMCGQCSLVNRGLDCHNNKIVGLLYRRTAAGLTQNELAVKAKMNIRQIQKFESGDRKIENITLKNALSLADALECDVRELL